MSGSESQLILVADDDDDIRALVTFRLERAGYEVISAADGDQAFALACERLPDLAVLDVMMPGSDGLEVTRKLRAREDTNRIPVILLTARAREGDVESGFDAGADDYLKKPFSPQELQTRVRAILGRR
jgi:DNA-binding response OmpR family regulator